MFHNSCFSFSSGELRGVGSWVFIVRTQSLRGRGWGGLGGSRRKSTKAQVPLRLWPLGVFTVTLFLTQPLTTHVNIKKIKIKYSHPIRKVSHFHFAYMVVYKHLKYLIIYVKYTNSNSNILLRMVLFSTLILDMDQCFKKNIHVSFHFILHFIEELSYY